MAASVTQTDVVNGAAALLGATERINSINGPGNLAGAARAVWQLAVEAVVADHPYNLFIDRAQLNAAAAAPAFGWERQFEKPANCLRVLLPRIGDDDYWDGEIEGNFILTNAEAPLNVRFISSAKIPDVGSWPPKVRTALMYRLAELLAESIGAGQGMAQRMEEGAENARRAAKRTDGLETPTGRRSPITRRSRWLSRRNTPYSGSWGD